MSQQMDKFEHFITVAPNEIPLGLRETDYSN